MTWMRSLIAILFALLFTAAADAHALGARWRLDRDRVVVEAYFSTNKPAQDAEVKIRDGEKVIAEGRTDDRGRWSFPEPPPGRYEILVDAGLGHQTTVELDLSPEHPPEGGPSREEFTRTPWLKLGLGLLVIAGLALGLYFSVRRSPPRA